jgi:hypothetical protein
MGDFVWVNPWTALVRSGVVGLLAGFGLRVSAVPANLRVPPSIGDDLLELEALPTAELHEVGLPKACAPQCDTCGRCPIQLPEHIVIASTSLDQTGFAQRLRAFPTILIVPENVGLVLRDMSLRNLLLDEVDVL